MRNYLILLVLVLLSCLFSVRADAAYVTGAVLKGYCSSEDPKDVLNCANYIAGIIDYNEFMQTMGVDPGIGFCLPKGVSIEEASFIVMKFLKENPNQDAFVAASSVIMALGKEYPCSGQ